MQSNQILVFSSLITIVAFAGCHDLAGVEEGAACNEQAQCVAALTCINKQCVSDQEAWKKVPLTITPNFIAMTGTSADDVWVATESTFYHFQNGAKTSEVNLKSGFKITRIYVTPQGDLFVFGSSWIGKWDGTSILGNEMAHANIVDLHGSDDGIYALGSRSSGGSWGDENSVVYKRKADGTWEELLSADAGVGSPHALWKQGDIFYIVGSRGLGTLQKGKPPGYIDLPDQGSRSLLWISSISPVRRAVRSARSRPLTM